MDPRVEVVVYNEPDTLENVFLRSAGLDLIMARAVRRQRKWEC
jgi:hypothetical protein